MPPRHQAYDGTRAISPSGTQRHPRRCTIDTHGERTMRKYVLAWLLGIPAGLLVLIYLFSRVF
ncbi:hypothetical protein [Dokdonella sp.]|uniref:hypothetical protein n=1 Tax=Dokdonella sp. TaxID=2291710 RepID=UPI001AFF158E|nr:hypothetical protein [Dokdonella sp.]MBO9664696.1 hypothetical protein [Dokdonella sp.]